MEMTYTFIKPLPVIGTNEYKAFRKYLWEQQEFHTRMRLTSLKEEYLVEYWNLYNEKLESEKLELSIENLNKLTSTGQ